MKFSEGKLPRRRDLGGRQQKNGLAWMFVGRIQKKVLQGKVQNLPKKNDETQASSEKRGGKVARGRFKKHEQSQNGSFERGQRRGINRGVRRKGGVKSVFRQKGVLRRGKKVRKLGKRMKGARKGKSR